MRIKKHKIWLLLLSIVLILSGCSKSLPEPTFENSLLKSNLETWGLGSFWIDYASSERSYEWYMDQGNTGTHSGDNCGPTSAAMAAKWYDEETGLTPEIARNAYASTGGWWYTNDVESILNDYKVPYEIQYDFTVEEMVSQLHQGRILLICNKMDYIPYNPDDSQRLNRFYTYNDGHFLIVKGYLKTEKGTFFEVYDPNSWGEVYGEGTLMGKDRYYESEALLNSIKNWWYAMFIIGE